ncbi:MAG: AI-2E family transporter [Bacillota bacterium]
MIVFTKSRAVYRRDQWYFPVAIGVVFLLLLLALKYLWLLAAPFVIGFFAAALLEPAVQRMRAFSHWPRKIAARFIFFSALFLLGMISIFFAWRLVEEFGSAVTWLQRNAENLNRWYIRISLFLRTGKWFPYGRMQLLLEDIAGACLRILQGMMWGMPQYFLMVLLSILTTFFLLEDREKLFSGLLYLLPERLRNRTAAFKDEIYGVIMRFLRAQLILVSSSFFYTWFVLLGMKAPNSFLWGLLAGLLDLIPLFGPSLVFVFWSVWFLLKGSYGPALLIFLAMLLLVVARQVIEPRIIGESIGFHPLAVLIVLYSSVKFYGAAGIFFGPLLLIMLKALYRGLRITADPDGFAGTV